MRGKITYLLVVLLFVAAGALCRSQQAQISGGTGRAAFSKQAPPDCGCAGRLLVHSLLAPEVMSTIPTLRSDHKIPFRNSVAPSLWLSATPEIPLICSLESADLHPDAVRYYIFSLEKIRI